MSKRLPLSLSYIFCSLCLLPASASLHAEELSRHLTTITDPTPKIRVSPKYPKSAARERREGWTQLSFVIGTDGKVSDPIVVNSSGSEDFDKASLKSVSQWVYEPAIENGKAVEQCANTVQLDFRMGKNAQTGVTRKFGKLLKQSQAALAAKDYEQVELLLAEMSEVKYRHLSENNYMHIMAASYRKEQGAPSKQLAHLRKIKLALLDENLQYSILNEEFLLQINLNKFKQAHKTYELLSKLAPAKDNLSFYQDTIAKVDDFIGSDKNIVQTANIEKRDFWFTPLTRNEFSLVDIKGALHKLDVRCANKRHVYTIEKNNTWTIPSSWNNCSIYVYGDDNTQFNLIEHPLKS